MTVAIEMGHTTAGAPANLDLEELLATRLLVQGNSGSGKSHLLRRLLEQSAPWVQQTIIDPEGDFVALADRFGRTTLTILAMAASGTCAVAIGFLFGAPPWVVLAVAIPWGLTVVADSAQFSAAVSELAPPGTAGSALSVQVAVGFILTGVTIVGVGLVDPGDGLGWRLAFGSLAIGPAIGVWAMWRLRQRPDALKMANGHR